MSEKTVIIFVLRIKMMDNKIPNNLLNTIKCIYRNTKIGIKFYGGISEPIHINKGVRQGCGLSPVLFNIYRVRQ